jgi:toluene monooxygenase system ferredoxin subunit
LLGETERPLKTYETKEENGTVLVNVVNELFYEFESEDDFDDDFFAKA